MTAPGNPKSDLSSTTPSVSAAITKGEGEEFKDETLTAPKASNATPQITRQRDSTDAAGVAEHMEKGFLKP